jgi:hypothetical protein
MNFLIVFDSVHHAIHSEQLLRQAGIVVEMIPTPREITASCGQSVTFGENDTESVKEVLERGKILFRGVFSVSADRRRYELLWQ